jgi:hypothetical protein
MKAKRATAESVKGWGVVHPERGIELAYVSRRLALLSLCGDEKLIRVEIRELQSKRGAKKRK